MERRGWNVRLGIFYGLIFNFTYLTFSLSAAAIGVPNFNACDHNAIEKVVKQCEDGWKKVKKQCNTEAFRQKPGSSSKDQEESTLTEEDHQKLDCKSAIATVEGSANMVESKRQLAACFRSQKGVFEKHREGCEPEKDKGNKYCDASALPNPSSIAPAQREECEAMINETKKALEEGAIKIDSYANNSIEDDKMAASKAEQNAATTEALAENTAGSGYQMTKLAQAAGNPLRSDSDPGAMSTSCGGDGVGVMCSHGDPSATAADRTGRFSSLNTITDHNGNPIKLESKGDGTFQATRLDQADAPSYRVDQNLNKVDGPTQTGGNGAIVNQGGSVPHPTTTYISESQITGGSTSQANMAGPNGGIVSNPNYQPATSTPTSSPSSAASAPKTSSPSGGTTPSRSASSGSSGNAQGQQSSGAAPAAAQQQQAAQPQQAPAAAPQMAAAPSTAKPVSIAGTAPAAKLPETTTSPLSERMADQTKDKTALSKAKDKEAEEAAKAAAVENLEKKEPQMVTIPLASVAAGGGDSSMGSGSGGGGSFNGARGGPSSGATASSSSRKPASVSSSGRWGSGGGGFGSRLRSFANWASGGRVASGEGSNADGVRAVRGAGTDVDLNQFLPSSQAVAAAAESSSRVGGLARPSGIGEANADIFHQAASRYKALEPTLIDAP